MQQSQEVVLYAERLWPAAWVWVCAVLVSAATFLIFVPISVPAAIIAPFVSLALLTWWLVQTSIRIIVTPQELRVAAAHVDRAMLGTADALSGADATHARGPGLDARAFLKTRGWISGVVKVELTDPADPVPYWLLSSREPAKLAAALGSRP
jgi:hypothetical protein